MDMKDIINDITVIITTSPTPSAPSTELLSATLASLRTHCPALISCPVITVFDTYSRVVPAARLKRGHVTQAMADNYTIYRRAAMDLILDTWEHLPPPVESPTDSPSSATSSARASPNPLGKETATHAEYGAPEKGQEVPIAVSRTEDGRVVFLSPATTLGFGLAVRSALRECTTRYVWVQQHDWALERDVPLGGLLGIMKANEERQPEENGDGDDGPPRIRYVSFPSVRMHRYASGSKNESHPSLRAATKKWKREFAVPSQCQPASAETPPDVPLTPLFFWYDKPHIACKEHYLSRIFSNDEPIISRGDFVEDTVGTAAREEMKAGHWAKWATWLYYPDDGETIVLRHLQGRTFRGKEEEIRVRALWRATGGQKKGRKAARAREAAAKEMGQVGSNTASDVDADGEEEDSTPASGEV